MSAAKENIILTSGSGYRFHHLRPFLDTLFKTTYDGEVAFFISDTDQATLQKLRKYPIKLIPFTYDYPYLSTYQDVTKHIPTAIDFVPHPKTIRYIMYLAYLKAFKEQYRNVMLTDIRDVIFQKNPFDFAINDKIYSFLEDKTQQIKDNYFNTLWIKEAFGQEALSRIGDNYIVCSGITIGSYHPMVKYLEKLTYYIINEVRDQGCKDQGIHNYVIYTNQVKNIELISDDEGAVSTISTHKPIDNIRIDRAKTVKDKQGQTINIVHQYDRHWKLLWKYNKRDYLKRRIDLIKQFLLAVIKAKQVKRSYLKNLRSILFNPMLKKYKWE